MAIFKKNKKEETKKVSTQDDNELKDEISKAYDEIMSGNKEEKAEEQPQQAPKDDIAFENEVFKSKVKAFKQERNQQNLIAVLKMLSGRKFLLPSVCNVEDPFEKLENGNVRLKEGTVFNPAFLTSSDKKVFLPIFTDEESMVQKSPSGVLLKLNFEQCVTVVYDEKNPVEAVVINPFTENMIIGIDLLKMVFKEKKKEEIFYDKKKKDHYMNHMFHGYDMDRTMLRIGAMNMMTHGIDNPFIEYRDSLSDQNQDKEQYSLVLANPPFKGSLDAESVSGDLLKVCKTKKTELLFLTLFLRILKIGGRCACIVPDGVLFGSSKAHKSIRKEIVENQRLEAVISMPSGVFKPYAGVSTAILIFTKTEHGGTDHVWFYDMKADGFSLDDKRTPVAENDIPDIIERFKNREKEVDRKRTEQSFMVPKKDIVENEYDLSINKYKEVEYIPVEYPPTSEIMANIRELENEIGKEMDELEKLLKM